MLLRCEGVKTVTVNKGKGYNPHSTETCLKDRPICMRDFIEFWEIEGNKAYSDAYLPEFELGSLNEGRKYDYVYFVAVDYPNLSVAINPATGEYFADNSAWHGDGNMHLKTGFCEKVRPKELFDYPPPSPNDTNGKNDS